MTGEGHIDNTTHQGECTSLVFHIGSKVHAIVGNGRIQIDRPAGIDGAGIHVQGEDEMLLRRAIDHCIEEERSRGKIDNGRSDNAKWVNRSPAQTGRDRRANIRLPDNAAIRSVERINIIRCGHGNDHWAPRTALDIKRLGVNIAHDCAVKVQVARDASSGRWRECRIDIKTVAGKIVVFLNHVDLGVCWKNHAPQTGNDEQGNGN